MLSEEGGLNDEEGRQNLLLRSDGSQLIEQQTLIRMFVEADAPFP